MPVLAFNHFTLRADAAMTAKLRAFYVTAAGLHEGWRPPFDFAGHWLYLGEQAVLHLVDDGAATAATAAAPPRSGSFDHIAFTSSDVAGFEARLKALQLPYRLTQVPGTELTQIFITDPSGNGVEFNFPAELA